MRSPRRVVLGVLLVLAALIGGVVAAPAATAEVDGIQWNVPTGHVPASYPIAVCATGYGAFVAGQEVRLDVMLGGTWVERATKTAAEAIDCLVVDTTEVLPGPGRYFLRARTENATGDPVSANTALEVTPEFGFGAINGGSLGGEQYLYTTTPDKAVTVQVVARGQSVDLQRRSGSQWLQVGRVSLPDDGSQAIARFRLPSKAGNVTYRLVNWPTTWSRKEISYSFVVHQTDYERYKNYLVKARQYMATYCPKTPIFIDTRMVDRSVSGIIGFAYTGSVPDPDRTGITSRIDLRSGLPSTALRNTALQMCAKVVQSRWVVEGTEAQEQAKAMYVFRDIAPPGMTVHLAAALNGQASCMAFLFTRVEYDGYFVRGCTKAHLASAQRIWQDYGTKYQAVPYYYDAP